MNARRQLLLYLFALHGCTPSLQTLVQRRQLNDAACGATQQNTNEARGIVGSGILRAIAPAVYVQEIPAEQWRQRPELDVPSLREHFFVLRFAHERTPSRVSDIQVSLALTSTNHTQETLAPSVETIAAATGERVAPRVWEPERTVMPGPLDHAAHAVGSALGSIASTMITIGTGGLLQPNFGGGAPPGPRTIPAGFRDPTLEEQAAASPIALTLSQGLQSYCSPTTLDCQQYMLVRRSMQETDPSLALRFTFHFSGGRSRLCSFDHSVTVPLPPGTTLSARLDQLFAGRMTPLEELTTR